MKVKISRIVSLSGLLALALHPSALRMFRGNIPGSKWERLIDNAVTIGQIFRILISTSLILLATLVVLGRFVKWDWLYRINIRIRRACCEFGFVEFKDSVSTTKVM